MNNKIILLFFIISINTYQSALSMDMDHLLIALDRSTYKLNEVVTFSIENKIDITIWYQNHNCHAYPELQKFEGQEWRYIDFSPTRLMHCPKQIEKIGAGEVIRYKRDYSKLSKQYTLPEFGPGRYRYRFMYYIQDISNYSEESPPADIKMYSSFSEEFVIQNE